MKIIGAIDSFKDSISAVDALNAIAVGVRAVDPNHTFIPCPVADGGEGTIDAITASHTTANRHTIQTTGPLPDQPVSATWAMLETTDKTALIEISSAAGYSLVPKAQRNPMHTTTFGIGKLIEHVLTFNPKHITIWLGGSATCDGGTGLAQALGATFTLNDNSALDQNTRPITGADLTNIKHVHPITPANLCCANGSTPTIRAACDVTNPLTGPNGSARIFAPQKGAKPEDVTILEHGLENLAAICTTTNPQTPRTGSAGGLGFGLATFLNAQLVSGIDLMLDLIDFDKHARGADLIITGEGMLDKQTRSGKAVMGITNRAGKLGIPVIALAGHINHETLPADLADQFHSMYAITDIATDIDDAMQNADKHLTTLTQTALTNFKTPPTPTS